MPLGWKRYDGKHILPSIIIKTILLHRIVLTMRSIENIIPNIHMYERAYHHVSNCIDATMPYEYTARKKNEYAAP